jgi:hypothetical protein
VPRCERNAAIGEPELAVLRVTHFGTARAVGGDRVGDTELQ